LVVEIAKALVLAGRTGRDRPWPSVQAGPKHLVPVANRPILFHHLEALRAAGVLEATIAVEPESARLIGAAVGDGSEWNLAVRYVEWAPASGVGGALAAARPFIGDEPVLVRPGDALQREQIHPHIAEFAGGELDAMALRLSAAPREGANGALPGGYLLSERAVSLLLDRPRTRWPACAATAARCSCATSRAASPATATRTRCSRPTGGCSRTFPGTSTRRRTPAPSSRVP
jgi:glucose-1-phosphate thymidylyltransferase